MEPGVLWTYYAGVQAVGRGVVDGQHSMGVGPPTAVPTQHKRVSQAAVDCSWRSLLRRPCLLVGYVLGYTNAQSLLLANRGTRAYKA